MSCVRFKFKSSLEYEKLTFDGLQLSVGELRKKIMTQKKLGMSDDFTLQIMDAQSKKSEKIDNYNAIREIGRIKGYRSL